MKVQESHKMSDEEVKGELSRLRRNLYDLKAQGVTQKLEDPSQFQKVRRDVARLMTEQRARQIAVTKKAQA